jgi:hypothetical protein
MPDEVRSTYQPFNQSLGAPSGVPSSDQTAVPLRSVFSLPIPMSRALLVRYITELGIHSPAAGVALFDSLLSGTSTSRTSLLSSLAGLSGAGAEITIQLGNRASSVSPGPARVVGDYLIGDNAEISSLIAQLFAVDGSSRDRSTAKSVIDTLRRVDPSSFAVDNAGRSEECSICQENFMGPTSSSSSSGEDNASELASSTVVLELPCCHHFHDECVLPWLEMHNTCPSCRAELPTDDSEYNTRKGLSVVEGHEESSDEAEATLDENHEVA